MSNTVKLIIAIVIAFIAGAVSVFILPDDSNSSFPVIIGVVCGIMVRAAMGKNKK